MIHNFYISDNRFDECKKFIRTLNSARFVYNPIKVGNKYNIVIELSVFDGNLLNQKFNEWYEQDNHKNNYKKSFLKTILSWIKR